MHATKSVSYSITSSARARSVGGTSSLSALAVLRFEFRGQLHRQVDRSLALEDSASVASSEAQCIRTRGSIAHQPASLWEIAALVDSWYRMARCQDDELFHPADEERVTFYQKRCGTPFHQGSESVIDLARVACLQDLQLQPKRTGGYLCLVCVHRGILIGRIHQRGNSLTFRQQLVQCLQHFRHDVAGKKAHAGNVAAGPVQTVDEAHLDRVTANSENDWNLSCWRLGSYRCVVGHCSNDRDSALDHIDSKRGKPISLTLGRSVLDYYVLAFDITDLAQALAELGQPTRVGFEWRGVEKRDHRYSRLLRPRSERPCCGTADHSNKVAPSHLPGPWLGTGIVTSNQETGRGQAVARRCPLWVKSRHSVEETRCPLYPQ